MKKILSMGVIILLAIGASLIVYASNVANSKHNMQSRASALSTTEICVFCHTPHGAITGSAPLWNHTLTTETFQLYNTDVSSTINGTVTQPSGVSLACLSCHDGSVAVDALENEPPGYNDAANTFTGNLSAAGALSAGNAFLDTDLRNDHPVSITYMDSDQGGGDPDIIPDDGAGQVDYSADSSIKLQLFGTAPFTVECGSCHDVHDDTYQPFLRADNDGSALCLSCHAK